MKVYNMTSPQGNTVANQFVIEDNGITWFQSYRSLIVKQEKGVTYLDEYYWDYSNTTGKYRNMFLNEDTKTIKSKIKSGEYKLVNLN